MDNHIYTLPAIEDMPRLSSAERATILDKLFEPSSQLQFLCLPLLHGVSLPDYNTLVQIIKVRLGALLNSSDNDEISRLDDVLRSHPRLGESKVESAQSRAEQAQLQSSDSDQVQELAETNALYEKQFPGLRYVVFVNGRPRSEILKDMQFRIDRNNIKQERLDAIQAMCDIALDRACRLTS